MAQGGMWSDTNDIKSNMPQKISDFYWVKSECLLGSLNEIFISFMALNKLAWHSLNEERDDKSFMGWNEFYEDETCVYTVSNTLESWKQGHKTPTETSLIGPSLFYSLLIVMCFLHAGHI
jgi:hypothetical protein